MTNATPPLLTARVRGPLACFTRPEFKAERFSYPVITPSAARGVFEAILWKPQMRWRIERIRVLRPIAYTSFLRNEVGVRAVAPSRAVIEAGGEHSPLLVEDRRQQRNTVALRDVDYIIEARIELTERAETGDNLAKYVDMFRRRLEKGQRFHQPYLGCREFIADVELMDERAPDPIDVSRDLGVMLWDMEFIPARAKGKGKPKGAVAWRQGNELVVGDARPVFFRARLERGVMQVPGSAVAAEATLQADAAEGEA